MKRIFILLALCLGVSIANGQAVGFYVSDGVVLNGNQWHYDNLSIIDAGGSNYLVITPTEYYYSYLPPLYTPSVNYIIGDVALSCRPYCNFGDIGWLVRGRCGYYFVYYVSNAWYSVKIASAPVYYNYSYQLCGVRYIDMRFWHFTPPPGPRHHHHHSTPPPPSGPRPHHHNGTPPPSSGHHHGTTPPPHSGNTTPPPPFNRGGSVSGSQRGSGTSVRPANPPSNGNGSVRPNNPPSGGNRGSSVRPSGPTSGGSRSGGYSPGSSHSSGRSSGVSAPRPSSGGRSGTPTRSSGGSPRRR